MILQKLRQRLAGDQRGFTLIELLIVIVIIGILIAIAVPSYLGFRERANEKSALANVRAAVPAVETFFAENIGAGESTTAGSGGDESTTTSGYSGMDLTELREIDNGVATLTVVIPTGSAATTYCISSQVGNKYARKNGPNQPVEPATAHCS